MGVRSSFPSTDRMLHAIREGPRALFTIDQARQQTFSYVEKIPLSQVHVIFNRSQFQSS